MHHCCRRKTVSIAYFACLCVRVRARGEMRACFCICVSARARACACSRVALLIQHTRYRHIVICGLWLHHIIRKRHDFRKKVTEHKMCILILSTTFIWSVSHYKKNSLRYCHKYEKPSCKVPHCSCRISTKFEFSPQIFENESPNFEVSSKSVQWQPSCLTRAGGRTDGRTDRHDDAKSRFRNFENAPKIDIYWQSEMSFELLQQAVGKFINI